MFNAVMAIVAVRRTRRDSRLWQPWTSQSHIKNYRHGFPSRQKLLKIEGNRVSEIKHK